MFGTSFVIGLNEKNGAHYIWLNCIQNDTHKTDPSDVQSRNTKYKIILCLGLILCVPSCILITVCVLGLISSLIREHKCL